MIAEQIVPLPIPPTPVGLREAARVLGSRGHKIAHTTIGRHVSAGVIPNHGSAARPKVMVTDVLARDVDPLMQRQESPPVLASSAPGGDAAPPLHSEAPAPRGSTVRDQHAQRKTELLDLELAEKRGQLLDKRQVLDAFATMGTAIVEALESRRFRLAKELVGLTAPGEIDAKLAAADTALLQALNKEVLERLGLALPSGDDAG